MGDVTSRNAPGPAVAPWWDRSPDLVAAAAAIKQGRDRSQSYRFGLGIFTLDCDDAGLNRRFGELYPEGAAGELDGDGPRVRCDVRSLVEPAVTVIRFDDPEELDGAAFCRAMFPDRSLVAGAPTRDGWHTICSAGRPDSPMIAMHGPWAIADRTQAWQPLVANLAVNRLLRLQRQLLCFHAGSARVAGRGLMLVGPKGSGKTTLSLTLASRGHPFLGDEIAVVGLDGRLYPFRRAASIRRGIRGEAVEKRLSQAELPRETFPDGSERVLANVARLFPDSGPGEATLSAVFFLRGFAPRPNAERFEFGRGNFGELTPLRASMWGMPPGLRLVQLARLMTPVRCYHLDVAAPDDTAALLERICEEIAA